MPEDSVELPDNITRFPGRGENAPRKVGPEKHGLLSWLPWNRSSQPEQIAPEYSPQKARELFRVIKSEDTKPEDQITPPDKNRSGGSIA